MSHIQTSAEGHVLEIRVSRAEKYNALSPEMYRDLALAYGRLDRDPELRVGLLIADGRNFTGGIELDLWAPLFAELHGFPVHEGGIDPFGIATRKCSKPVVIAVQGYCYTWGVEVLLNTEVRVAAEDTRFAMLEVQRGLYPLGGATLRLPQQMGVANAQRHLLTGDPWTAQEAYRLGMVQEVVPAGDQQAAARAIANRIAAGAPLGVRAILRSTQLSIAESESEARRQLFDDLPEVMTSEDLREGVQSFVERRAAVFKGR